jgi:tetratricopeptide (TPR) repeat protein
MAPEQAAGHSNRVGPHTDVYALGAILYECLTGRPPFRADSELNTLLQVLHEEPVAPRRLVPSVPRDLETICLKCLHKVPERRYPSAEALADDLGRFLGGMPVQARPVGRVERIRLWARRKPTAAALAVVSVLAVLLLVGSTTAYALRLQRALKAEKEQHQQAVANLKRAREAVQRFFIKTSTSHLLNVPGLQALRRDLLQDALHFYQELVREYAGNPGIESELGATYEYMGSAYFVLGRGDEAREALENSLAVRRGLVANEPGNPERRNELASTLANLGLVNQNTQPARALECYEEALRLREEVVAQEPTPEHRSDLADTLADLGTLLKGMSGRAEQAMRLLERAHVTREGLNREAPSEENTSKLAKLYNQLANLQTDQRRKPDALVNYKKALALRQALLKASPNNLTYLNDLAWSENNLGLLLSEIGTPEEALAHYERSMALRRRLARENPAVVDFQHNLASSCNNLGLLYYRISGKEKEARAAFQEALALRQKILAGHPGNLIYLARLGHVYQNLGNLESAIGKKEEALRSYQGALKIRREVAERTRRRPGELDALRDLAYTIGLVGKHLAALGRHEEALKLLEEARRLNQRLVDENPSDLKRKDHLGACLVALAAVLREQGKEAEALKRAEAGVAQARAAAEKDRGVTEYQGNLARALHERGQVREELHDRGAALADYREAVAISVKLTAAKKRLAEQQGELAKGRFLLGRALRRGGQAEQAVAELRAAALLRGALVRASPNNVGERSELALTWAELGLALAQAGDLREARVALTKAVEGQQECVARAPGFGLFARRLEEHRGALAGLGVRPTR